MFDVVVGFLGLVFFLFSVVVLLFFFVMFLQNAINNIVFTAQQSLEQGQGVIGFPTFYPVPTAVYNNYGAAHQYPTIQPQQASLGGPFYTTQPQSIPSSSVLSENHACELGLDSHASGLAGFDPGNPRGPLQITAPPLSSAPSLVSAAAQSSPGQEDSGQSSVAYAIFISLSLSLFLF